MVTKKASPARTSVVPAGKPRSATIKVSRKELRLSNLGKIYFPEAGHTKGDLLRYYDAVAPVLLPHLKDRAMVMKRFPNGIHGKMFFMKRTPDGAPEWVERCDIEHKSKSVIDFPMAQDLASLLWLVNLGCVDLNPWYGRCEDTDRPDFLHFDLDPVEPADFAKVRDTALVVKDALDRLKMRSYVKTTGSSGIHIYVPIVHGPLQKQVWTFAKGLAFELARRHPSLITAEYRIKNRPPGRVLVDYNQNAWGRTLASVYSVRPKPRATVSAPVTWQEVEAGVDMDDFRLDTMPARLAEVGDLWAPLLRKRGRVDLEPFL